MTTTFDQRKFEALVHYVAERTRGIADFGRTKLAKVLFYSDFNAYRDEGEPLTGATYIRMPFGPFPRDLPAAEQHLAAEGRVQLVHDVDEYEAKRIVSLRPAEDAQQFYEGWQLLLVDMWIEQIRTAAARRISELSHEHPGWILAVETGMEIPYASAFAPDRPPPDAAVELGRRLALEHKWP